MDEASESAIQRSILDGLLYKGYMAWRNNVAPIPIRRGREITGFRRIDPHVVGMADILCVLKPSGRLLGIEVKTPKGRLTEKQRDWGEKLEANGGAYLVARSWEDVETYLEPSKSDDEVAE